jgi:hypothetical protein
LSAAIRGVAELGDRDRHECLPRVDGKSHAEHRRVGHRLIYGAHHAVHVVAEVIDRAVADRLRNGIGLIEPVEGLDKSESDVASA